MAPDLDKVFPIIIGMALVTYFPRMLPLVTLSRTNLPPIFLRWLSFVPPAVLAALLIPGLLMPGGQIDISMSNNPYLLAALSTLLVAWRTKDLMLTLLAGMASMVLFQRLF